MSNGEDQKAVERALAALQQVDGVDVPGEMVFHYLKSNHFRVVLVDGGIGGADGRGRVSMGIYNERRPIPRQTVQSTTQIGGEKPVDARDGVIREVEAELIMSAEVAEQIGHWLIDRAAQAREIQALTARLRDAVQGK